MYSMKVARATIALLLAVSCTASPRAAEPITIGAVYPTGGSQGPGGLAEYRGAQLAAELVNARGGIGGRMVRLQLEHADSADQAPGAVRRLAGDGVQMILGSHGSTISQPAADTAEQTGVIFWETGAVGLLDMAAHHSDRVFRFAPTGATLGRTAVTFARDIALPRLHRNARALRYAVTYVDDSYGRSVGLGAIAQLHTAGLQNVGVFPYDVASVNYATIAKRVARARADVLFVSAYLADGIAMRKAMVRLKVPLVASVGTSSSYCMHEFGVALGKSAVGLYASDKPDGHVLDPKSLAPDAAAEFTWARDEFAKRYNHEMTAGALTGFAGAWALMHYVLPAAHDLRAPEIATAARAVRVPMGELPNGSGLAFGPAGGPSGGDNERATSVIWEWVRPGVRAVVWPPAFATSPVLPLGI